jgi:hypothetical protein
VARVPKRWTVATARQHLPKLLALAAREPQAVYRRDTLVATVVNPKLAAQVEETRAAERSGTLADDLAELRRLCAEEDYVLTPPRRVDRVAAPRGPSLGRSTRAKGTGR